jgi:hypothetical protein
MRTVDYHKGGLIMTDPNTNKPDVRLAVKSEIDNNFILTQLNVKPQENEKAPFDGYLTVGENTKLEINFTNKTDHMINKLETKLIISYPDHHTSRECIIEIENIEINKKVSKIFRNFFIPEFPGSHIVRIENLNVKENGKPSRQKFISSPGIAGSKYRTSSLNDTSLNFPFDVYSKNDLITLKKLDKQEKTSTRMLWITAFLLIITIIRIIYSYWDDLQTVSRYICQKLIQYID